MGQAAAPAHPCDAQGCASVLRGRMPKGTARDAQGGASVAGGLLQRIHAHAAFVLPWTAQDAESDHVTYMDVLMPREAGCRERQKQFLEVPYGKLLNQQPGVIAPHTPVLSAKGYSCAEYSSHCARLRVSPPDPPCAPV